MSIVTYIKRTLLSFFIVILIFSLMYLGYSAFLNYSLSQSTVKETEYEYIKTIHEVPVYRGKDYVVTDELLIEIEEAIDSLPAKMYEKKPRRIILGNPEGHNYAYGVLVEALDIYITRRSLNIKDTNPSSGLSHIHDVLFHEWMHRYMLSEFFDDYAINNILGLFFKDYKNDLHAKFATSVGWKSRSFLGISVIGNELMDDKEKIMQTPYGKTNHLEDAAETARLFLSGQHQLLSEDRNLWFENHFGVSRSEYAMRKFPYPVDVKIEKSKYVTYTKMVISNLQWYIDGGKDRELVDRYKYAEYYIFDNNVLPDGYRETLVFDLKERGFLVSYDGTSYYIYGLDSSYILTFLDNKISLLYGTDRTLYLPLIEY